MEEAIQIVQNKTALVISGGGVLGSSAVASLKRFIEFGFDLKNIKSVSGSSVGSIIATAIACGADIDYILEKMQGINYQKLKNKKCILVDAFRLLKDFGLYDMEEVRNLISSVLLDLVGNKDITFKELYEKTGVWLTVTYLSFNYKRTIFADHVYEPDSLVREAVVKSSAIPVFFEGYFEKKGHKKELIVDGGTMKNFPMDIPHLQGVDPREILGLKFVPSDSLAHKNIPDNGQPGTEEEWEDSPTNILSYLNDLIQILRQQAMKVHVKEKDWMNTVKINIGTLKSTDFDMSETDKAWLFKQGEKSADDYIYELANLIQEGKYSF